MSKNLKHTITVKNVHKSFGKLQVLKGVTFEVQSGSILALLGPNGAGKTTTIRILSTLLDADSGTVTVAGNDIHKHPDKVRASIGLTGQYAAVDEYLTGAENLLMIGRLYRLSKTDAVKRTQELIEQFDLVKASTRPVKTYSGGMRRRLDLAMSLIASPPVIFLDEPTTGLDPRSRQTMWDIVKQLAKQGTTILLTTQYMEEADQLADRIIVIDGGRVIAEGTPDALKAKVGSDRIEVTIASQSGLRKAGEVLRDDGLQIDSERRILSVASKGGVATLKQVLSDLEKAKIKVESVSLHRPTLDDVFLTLTGRTTGTEEPESKKGKGKH